MTSDEACELLVLKPGADSAAVRAAYLRAVKAHPPERDPDGFQRVREAYELLRRAPGPRPIVVTHPGQPVVVPEPSAAAPAPIAPPAHTPIAPPVQEPPPPPSAAPSVGDVATAWERAALDGTGPPGRPASALHVATCAIEAGLVPDGLRLLAAVRSVVEQDASEARSFQDADAWAWAHLRELGALPADYPRAPLVILLAAVRDGNLALARQPLLDAQRPTSREAYDTLRLRAPELFAAVFGWDPRKRHRPKKGVPRWLLWLASVFLCVGLLARKPEEEPPVILTPYLDSVADAACIDLAPGPDHAVCSEARGVRDALAERRCVEARVGWTRFRKAYAAAVEAGEVETDPDVARQTLLTFAQEKERLCPG